MTWCVSSHGICRSQISQVVIPLDMIVPTEKLMSSESDSPAYSQEWVVFDVFAG